MEFKRPGKAANKEDWNKFIMATKVGLLGVACKRLSSVDDSCWTTLKVAMRDDHQNDLLGMV